MAMLQRERNGALFGVHGVTTLKKYLTTPALLETPVCTNSSTENPLHESCSGEETSETSFTVS
jgi:hypothetical protein